MTHRRQDGAQVLAVADPVLCHRVVAYPARLHDQSREKNRRLHRTIARAPKP